MVKTPRPGLVKTRLVPPLTRAEAAMLSVSFLQDTLNTLRRAIAVTQARGLVVYTPADSADELAPFLSDGLTARPQQGATLGHRLAHLCNQVITHENSALCVIGADTPTLPASFLIEAAGLLEQDTDRLVLGPAEDGGYYLIGLKRAHLRLFDGISWGSSAVLAETLARAAEIGLPVMLLPPWYDVDDAAALCRLYDEITASENRLAPYTRLCLNSLQAAGRLRGLFQW
jgi:hypothetical protein